MGYKASKEIDPLDYDFNPFADIKGVTPEFTVERIKDYWTGYQKMQRAYIEELTSWEKRREEMGDNPDQGALDDFNEKFEEWSDKSTDTRQEIRRRLLAALCDEKPSYEELSSLPGRVFDDFESAMREALTPKARRNAGT